MNPPSVRRGEVHALWHSVSSSASDIAQARDIAKGRHSIVLPAVPQKICFFWNLLGLAIQLHLLLSDVRSQSYCCDPPFCSSSSFSIVK
jgi:hypothetical protein